MTAGEISVGRQAEKSKTARDLNTFRENWRSQEAVVIGQPQSSFRRNIPAMPSIPVLRRMRLAGSGVAIAGVYVPDTVVVIPPFVLLKLQVNGLSATVMVKVCVPPCLPRKLPVIIPVRPPVAGLNRIPDRLSVKPELQVRHPPLTLIVEKLVMVNKPPALTVPRVKVALPGGPTGLVWAKETVNCSPMLKLLASARGVAASKATNRTKPIVIQVVTEGFAKKARVMSGHPLCIPAGHSRFHPAVEKCAHSL